MQPNIKGLSIALSSTIVLLYTAYSFSQTGAPQSDCPTVEDCCAQGDCANTGNDTPLDTRKPRDNLNFPHFPEKLCAFKKSSWIPHNVDADFVNALKEHNQLPQARRLFDILSWQTFLAVNGAFDN